MVDVFFVVVVVSVRLCVVGVRVCVAGVSLGGGCEVVCGGCETVGGVGGEESVALRLLHLLFLDRAEIRADLAS